MCSSRLICFVCSSLPALCRIVRAQVAHLVLNETAASSLLRRFIECRSNLLKDILDGSGAAWPGQNDKRDMLGGCRCSFRGSKFQNIPNVLWQIVLLHRSCIAMGYVCVCLRTVQPQKSEEGCNACFSPA